MSGMADSLTPVDMRGLYEAMVAAHGRTDWWPADSLFEIIVDAVLIQNTTQRNAEKALDLIRAAGALDPRIMRDLDMGEIARIVRPAGFYTTKSRAIRGLADWYVERWDADPANAAGVPDGELRDELLGLFGVGNETADDILLYVFDRPAFIADTYSRRLFGFLGAFDEGAAPRDYTAMRRWAQPRACEGAGALDVAELKEFHGQIDEFGKICRTREQWAALPLAGLRYRDDR